MMVLRAVIIIAAAITLLDYLLILGVYKERERYDLFMPAADSDLHCRSNNREAEYKVMKVFFDLPDGFYAIKNNELFKVDLPIAKFEGAKSIKIKSLEIAGVNQDSLSEDINHVSYEPEQMGYDK